MAQESSTLLILSIYRLLAEEFSTLGYCHRRSPPKRVAADARRDFVVITAIDERNPCFSALCIQELPMANHGF
jgi:hypothetical protein